VFKKMTAILMVAAVTNAYAFTPVKHSFDQAAELKRTYDELNYKLNVEWDQHDSKFRDDALNDFQQDLETLQRQGLTSDTLVEYTKSQIKDKQVRDDMNSIAKAIHENKMSPDEARAFAMSKVNGLYAKGASWSGSRIHMKAVLLVAVIIILVSCLKGHDGKDGKDGRDGIDGKDGKDGKDGTDGRDGECEEDHGQDNGGNNGYGNGDQDAPGNSCENNNAENSGCAA